LRRNTSPLKRSFDDIQKNENCGLREIPLAKRVLQLMDDAFTLAIGASASQLELNGSVVHSGDWLELCVLGYWIPGQVAVDDSGWYFLTLNHVGIRLRPGLRARFCENPRGPVPSGKRF
jgi:hypothetical protein